MGQLSSRPGLPLAAARVIEIGTRTAGSLCGMLLADQGADVVKALAPGGGERPRLCLIIKKRIAERIPSEACAA